MLTALALVLALSTSAAGGGMVGAVAATRWLAPPAAAPAPLAAQPLSLAAPQASAAAAQALASVSTTVNNVAGAVAGRASRAVVHVVVSGPAASGPMRSGNGSGFVVDERGYVLTNNHVVEGARTISVRFADGATREGQVLGTDRGNDLALLRVDPPTGIVAALLGDSDQVELGEVTVAIGSPFGLEQTLTQGIVSAVHRTWSPGGGRVRRNLIQTDTPINPGNSGGPLLNARGEVIGVTSMIESPVRGSVGVGFAVPINTAKRLIPQLEAGAQLEPVWLGISGLTLDGATARDQGLGVEQGVLVTNVVPDSPAARAGLRGGQGTNERIPRGGDVIVALDDVPVRDMTELTDRLTGHVPGDRVAVTIYRSGQPQRLDLLLQAWPRELGG